jgi:hypothetical protein
MKKIEINLEKNEDENKINEFEFDFFYFLKQYSKNNINFSSNIINVYIDDKSYDFKKIDKISTTSTFYQYKNQYLMKVTNDSSFLKHEIKVYERLKNHQHFPKIIKYTNEYIIFENVGEILNPHNLPLDSFNQIKIISKILTKEKIKHNDIRENEILVKNGMIYLVDFNRAILDSNENLSQNYNDLYHIIKKFYNLKNIFNKTIKKF